MPEKVMIGMSGGVDSSVSALLLQEAGYECLGVTLRLYDGEMTDTPEGRTCCSLSDVEDAKAAAYAMGMKHYVLNARNAFEEAVIRDFVRAYEAGETPNPCIRCNRRVKFPHMYQKARELGCDYIATGHYARIERRADGRWLLKKGLDPAKDQSYVLYGLSQEILAHTQFPLGGLTKTQVREIAQAKGLTNAKKRDSQDICFVPDGDYESFIRRYTGGTYPPGDFVDETGRILGQHRGMIGYTVGQRRGLGVVAAKPLYVLRKDMDSNRVVLSGNEALFSHTLRAVGLNLIDRERIDGPLRCQAKIRYSHSEAACIAEQTGEDELTVTFDEPQRAITPGQAVVLYDGDTVIGGGKIAAAKI